MFHSEKILIPSRRSFLRTATFGTASLFSAGAFAEMLSQTPEMTEGPFYPDKLPLDTDNDLLIINDNLTSAIGEITHLTGKVLKPNGDPLRNAFVEIWQVDNQGAYIHSQSGNADKADKNFQGYGRFLTNKDGEYYFRTIKPVPYPGRTPHIHIGVSRNGHRIFTSQVFVKGEPQNQKDGLLMAVRDPKARQTLEVAFDKIPDSKIGELSATFDVVLGKTLQENDEGKFQGGIGKPERETRRRR